MSAPFFNLSHLSAEIVRQFFTLPTVMCARRSSVERIRIIFSSALDSVYLLHAHAAPGRFEAIWLMPEGKSI